jgi:hypothetical protein
VLNEQEYNKLKRKRIGTMQENMPELLVDIWWGYLCYDHGGSERHVR